MYRELMEEKDYYEAEALKVIESNPAKAELFMSIAKDYEAKAKALTIGEAE